MVVEELKRSRGPNQSIFSCKVVSTYLPHQQVLENSSTKQEAAMPMQIHGTTGNFGQWTDFVWIMVFQPGHIWYLTLFSAHRYDETVQAGSCCSLSVDNLHHKCVNFCIFCRLTPQCVNSRMILLCSSGSSFWYCVYSIFGDCGYPVVVLTCKSTFVMVSSWSCGGSVVPPAFTRFYRFWVDFSILVDNSGPSRLPSRLGKTGYSVDWFWFFRFNGSIFVGQVIIIILGWRCVPTRLLPGSSDFILLVLPSSLYTCVFLEPNRLTKPDSFLVNNDGDDGIFISGGATLLAPSSSWIWLTL